MNKYFHEQVSHKCFYFVNKIKLSMNNIFSYFIFSNFKSRQLNKIILLNCYKWSIYYLAFRKTNKKQILIINEASSISSFYRFLFYLLICLFFVCAFFVIIFRFDIILFWRYHKRIFSFKIKKISTYLYDLIFIHF